MSISDSLAVIWHSDRPLNPNEGDVYYDTTHERVMGYYSGTWFAMMSSDYMSRLQILENRDKLLTQILEEDAK